MIHIEIMCDEGRTVGDGFDYGKAYLLRELLKAKGWKTGPGGTDYCPGCWKLLRERGELDVAGRRT